MRLRLLRAKDIERLDWLAAVAEKAGYERWASMDVLAAAISGRREAEGSNPPLVLCIDEDGPQGIIEYAVEVPLSGAAQVGFIAVDPSRRRLGIGGRAALALERRLKRSVGRIYVAVPARIGIALYFWLRLGYRPLTQAEWPVQPDDAPSTWVARDVGGPIPPNAGAFR
jgi:GNAT superfamily N-acetyltransferase